MHVHIEKIHAQTDEHEHEHKHAAALHQTQIGAVREPQQQHGFGGPEQGDVAAMQLHRRSQADEGEHQADQQQLQCIRHAFLPVEVEREEQVEESDERGEQTRDTHLQIAEEVHANGIVRSGVHQQERMIERAEHLLMPQVVAQVHGEEHDEERRGETEGDQRRSWFQCGVRTHCPRAHDQQRERERQHVDHDPLLVVRQNEHAYIEDQQVGEEHLVIAIA